MNEQPRVLPKPTDWDELYPGRFVKVGELKGKNVTLRIADVDLEELGMDADKKTKGVISFEKTPKKLALNKTNGLCIREMFGKKLSDWIGKRITLFPSTWNGEDCIRIWGSPDIDADKDIVVQLPRKRPIAMKMHKVGAPTAVKSASPAATPISDENAQPPDDDGLPQ